MTEPTVTVESESQIQNHWFLKCFYRKEGYKFTLIPSRYHSAALLLFCLSYGAFLFQNPPSTKSAPQGGFSSSQNVPRESQNQSLDPLGKAAPQNKTEKHHSSQRTTKVAKAGYQGPQVVTRPVLPIPEGTLFMAKLITGASDGPVRAVVPHNVALNGETVLEAGTVLVGAGTSSDDRLAIHFTRMVFKNGQSQNISATAYDPEDKMPGLRGSRLGNHAIKIAGSVGLNFVGGVSEGLEETNVQNGVGIRPSTLKNALLNGASRTAIEESQNLMSSLKSQKPVVAVSAGKEVLISFEGNQNE